MYWWKIKHKLDYHGESITEVSYVQARTTIDALHELMKQINRQEFCLIYMELKFVK